MPYRLVADENIPFAAQAFGHLGEVSLCDGRTITVATVQNADILLVRSVTRVDAALLGSSRVQFVGSTTIGTDHVDQAYLKARNITFAHAPGCNAEAVVEYVLAALFRLSVRRGEPLFGKVVGVVGCGNIGRRLVTRLEGLGLRVLRNDPPLADAAAQAGQPHPYVDLETLLATSDVVTLHVPLNPAGSYATHHLIDAAALQRMKPGAWLINTCRGAVVDNQALKAALAQGHPAATVLDVWENEPTPDPDLLPRVDLATPHIAGHSVDGKVGGTLMVYNALMRHLGEPPAWDTRSALAPTDEDRLDLSSPSSALADEAWLDALVRQMYDLEADDAAMRQLLAQPLQERGRAFVALRKHYPRRRSFNLHRLPAVDVPEALRSRVMKGLGIPLG